MSPLLAEAKVEFTRELSALVARTPDGESRAWPVVHTIQVDGVCDEVIAPAQDIPVEVAAAAEDAALRIAARTRRDRCHGRRNSSKLPGPGRAS